MHYASIQCSKKNDYGRAGAPPRTPLGKLTVSPVPSPASRRPLCQHIEEGGREEERRGTEGGRKGTNIKEMNEKLEQGRRLPKAGPANDGLFLTVYKSRISYENSTTKTKSLDLFDQFICIAEQEPANV